MIVMKGKVVLYIRLILLKMRSNAGDEPAIDQWRTVEGIIDVKFIKRWPQWY